MPTGSDELRKLIDDLGEIPVELRRELRPAIRVVAGPVLAQARANASWSARIPAAMRIAPSFSQKRPGVAIVVSAARAPHARPYEDTDGDGRLRHPVWGHRDRWVEQSARPSLFPAVRSTADAAMTEEVGRVVEQVARAHGFR